MVKVTGKAAVSRYMSALPGRIDRVLRGAARAGAAIVADEVKLRADADETREGVIIRSKRDGDRIIVRISVKRGWGLTLGIWQEWGTAGHFITVDDRQRDGMSVNRINKLQKAGSLVIGGQFVGSTVWHPGARANPFMRPALDLKGAEAIAAAQNYITAKLKGGATPDPEGEEA